uniref:BAT2 N-terminal domain-containing protein n=1 Tax=Kalanchoe fedtschenkoi TaxID=63787 RepID=A0A7N0RCI0_KALFE
MASSMGTGERKWASTTRRGGMTVLGKVAVPKPINLPSQKLENHGMDPNVDIVPKGTLSWGSRSSLPASNAWGTSSLSLNTENGRPSSGGSGTRPSTGGSDKAYESSTNAWGSNSRPSSASGTLMSNQASGTSLRPHSADTRPGSSQLSRFAEPSNENLGACAAAGSGDNTAHPKNRNFFLSSGDFPTLGSEKEDPPKNTHISPEGDAIANARVNTDNVNYGRRDNPPYEEERQPNSEKWRGEALQRNPNMSGPHQQFPSWHGVPVGSPPVGVWYRGPQGPPYVSPGGPPYGLPGAPPYGPSGAPPYRSLIGPGPPGGFPVEHPYYHPPMPAPVVGNSQPVPHHGAGPRGLHQNNGETYRPHMSDGHFRPGIPMRPGFFPGPVPYESYYPPPMGYCGPNDRDHPFMGPAEGSAVFDRHLNPNALDIGNSQSANEVHGPSEKPVELVPSGQRHNPREHYKVLLKQEGDGHEWGGNTSANDSRFEKGYHGRPSSYERDHRVGSFNGEKIESRRRASREGGPAHGSVSHRGSQFPERERLSEGAKNMKGASNAEKNVGYEVSASEAVVAPKDSSLTKKTEGLNAIDRRSDGKQDIVLKSGWDEGNSRSHMNSKAVHLINSASNFSITHAKSHDGGGTDPPISHGIEAATTNKNYELTGADGPILSRKLANTGPQIIAHYRGKGKPDISETDVRHRKPRNGHISTTISSSNSELVQHEVQDHRSSNAGKPVSSIEGKDIVPDSESLFDPVDIQEQRAKKREIAKQRAMQLQREEEERIKEQKAKAQAKLEELNRRTKLMENSTEKVEMASSVETTNPKQEDPHPEPPISTAMAPNSRPSLEVNSLKPTNSGGPRALEPQLQKSEREYHGDVMSHHQSPAEPEGGSQVTDAGGKPQRYEGNNSSKSKRKGFKEKQNAQPGKSATIKIAKASVDALKFGSEAREEVSMSETVLAEPVVPQRTKQNKSGKNKQKMEEASLPVVMATAAPKITDVVKASTDSGKPQSSTKVEEHSHLPAPVGSKDWAQSTEPQASQLNEETQTRVNNHSRHQNSRKQPRNQQGNRAIDKSHGSDTVVWAPVRQQNKEGIEDSTLKVASGEAGDHIRKTDHVQSNIKNKRAEIERYVPKPVARELAHQGGLQQPTSPTTNSIASSAIKVETGESRIGESNYNRHARAPGAWRQPVFAETSGGQGPEDGSLGSTVVSKDIKIPTDKNQVADSDSSESREKKKLSDGWNSSDEWNSNTSKVPDASVLDMRDQLAFNKGKRHYNKGSRNTGTYSRDGIRVKGQTWADADAVHTHIMVSNNDEQDRTASRKEPNLEGGQLSSHWHSKSHEVSAHNQRSSRLGGAGHDSGGETSRFVKKESTPHRDHFQPKDVKLADGVSNRPNAPAEANTAGSFANRGPQDSKRDRKLVATQAGSHPSNPNSHAQVEQVNSVEHQHDRPRSSSGIRKNGGQSNRNVRGHEYQGEWNSFEQDRRYHNQTSSRGRPKHNNAHYEYKPKGQGHFSSTDGGNLHMQRQAIPIQVQAVGSGTD